MRRISLVFAFLLAGILPALGSSTWTAPTADELKMTADAAAPDAPAVYLYREEIVDDKLHFHRMYARVKILTEKGREEFGDIEIPYESGATTIRDVQGRTIHPDGSVVPFTGKPYDKELVKRGKVKIMAKVFSMPDVQVGSILEYRWEMGYDDHALRAPEWEVQQDVFVHKAHYHFNASESNFIVTTDAKGHENAVTRLLWYQNLPGGQKVQEGFGGYDLVVENIPALPQEEYEPPLESFAYRVIFYYSPDFSGEDFWKHEGKVWSKEVDRFASPSDTIRQAVAQMVAPGDTDEQKLRKIYAAVMGLENTRFTRTRSAEENKAEGLKVKTAADIWAQKRGTDDEITRLFIAMARAAGLKAYAMIVTERNRALMNQGYLNWGQLEDEIAIVEVGGKEEYFDPGQRYCSFARLHWMHTAVRGVRQTESGTQIADTPGQTYQQNQMTRVADLAMGANGTVTGQLRIMMTGDDALRWRQRVLRSDEQEAKKEFEDQMQRAVPDGVQVKMDHFLGLTTPDSLLMAVLNVSGSMGTVTGKRVFLPGEFFEARRKPLFAEAKRESMVDLRYPYLAKDTVTVTLPPGLTVEGLPKAGGAQMAKLADYQAAYGAKGNIFQAVRLMALATPLFTKEEYPQLRDFYQKASAQDQQPVVLVRSPVAAGGAAGK